MNVSAGIVGVAVEWLYQLRHFVHLFSKHLKKDESPPPGSSDLPALLDLSLQSYFTNHWLSVVIPNLSALLQEHLSVRVTHPQGPLLHLTHLHSGAPLTSTQVQTLVDHLESLWETKAIHFPYKEIADKMIKGCARIIELDCPYLDSKLIEKIHIEVNAVCGLEDMIPYETKWCAWPDYGFVSMPDVDNLPQGHLDFMRKKSYGDEKVIPLGRFLALFGGSCYRTPCHEVIHCIQSIAKQKGNTFQAEHDASYAMMSLLCSVCEVFGSEANHLGLTIPVGLKELLVAQQVYTGRQVWDHWKPAERAEYETWRNSFGLVESPGWRQEGPEGLLLESQMKTIIGAEGVSPSGPVRLPDQEFTRAVLNLLFENRTGEVLKQPINIPPALKIEQERIIALSQPSDNWKQVLEKIPK